MKQDSPETDPWSLTKQKRQYSKSPQPKVLEWLDICMQENEPKHRSYMLHRNQMDHRPKCKQRTIKLLGENIREKRDDLYMVMTLL